MTDPTIRAQRDLLPWRATPEERRARLPGDELVPAPLLQTTRAVTMDVPPQQVWPWLVQTGQGRAGFYSDSPFWDRCVDWYYRRLSREEPGTAEVGYHVAADDRVVASWQNRRVGDVIADGPPGTAYYVVRQAEPDRLFVLYTDTHLPHLLPSRLRDNPRLRIHGEVSDAVVLSEVEAGRTRLVRRMRMTCGPWPFRLLAVPIVLVWGDWVTERNFLRGVKRRAERTPRESPLPAVHPESVLDRYLPEFDVRERQTRLMHADVGAVQTAIGQTDLTGIPVVRALLVLRALPGRLRARLGGPATPVPPPFTLADMPRAGWTPLAEGPEEVGFGTLTQPWRIGNEASQVVDRESFAALSTPGYAKVAFSIRADPAGPHRTRVTTETRVATTDPGSRRRFAAYWVVVGPLSALIRRLVLRRLALHVEHQ